MREGGERREKEEEGEKERRREEKGRREEGGDEVHVLREEENIDSHVIARHSTTSVSTIQSDINRWDRSILRWAGQARRRGSCRAWR